MSFNSNPTTVIIEGNTIDYGAGVSGVSQFQYTYYSLLNTNADCQISQNTFTGIASNVSSGVMVQFTGNSSCTVKNNLFLRQNSLLQYYVNCNSGTNDHVITHNYFDNTTPDGTNVDNLVVNISSTSKYRENKNQSAYVSFPLYNSHNLTDLGTVSVSIYPNPSADYLSTFLDLIASPTVQWDTFIQLGTFVPAGAKVSYVAVGVYNDDGGGNIGTINVASNTNIFIEILKQTNDKIDTSNPAIRDPGGSFEGGILDTFDTTTNSANYKPSTAILNCNDSAVVSGMYDNTSYMYMDVTGASTDFTVNAGHNIILHWGGRLQTINGSETYLYYSPVVIRYIW